MFLSFSKFRESKFIFQKIRNPILQNTREPLLAVPRITKWRFSEQSWIGRWNKVCGKWMEMRFAVETEQGWEVHRWKGCIDLNHLRLFWWVRANLFSRACIHAAVVSSETGLSRYWAIIISFSFLTSATSSLHDTSDTETGRLASGTGIECFAEMVTDLCDACCLFSSDTLLSLCKSWQTQGRS